MQSLGHAVAFQCLRARECYRSDEATHHHFVCHLYRSSLSSTGHKSAQCSAPSLAFSLVACPLALEVHLSAWCLSQRHQRHLLVLRAPPASAVGDATTLKRPPLFKLTGITLTAFRCVHTPLQIRGRVFGPLCEHPTALNPSNFRDELLSLLPAELLPEVQPLPPSTVSQANIPSLRSAFIFLQCSR